MDAVFVKAILSGIHQRNLEASFGCYSSFYPLLSGLFIYLFKFYFSFLPNEWQRAWDKPVLDRVGLIIEIFNAHAYTKEAKLQVLLVFFL